MMVAQNDADPRDPDEDAPDDHAVVITKERAEAEAARRWQVYEEKCRRLEEDIKTADAEQDPQLFERYAVVRRRAEEEAEYDRIWGRKPTLADQRKEEVREEAQNLAVSPTPQVSRSAHQAAKNVKTKEPAAPPSSPSWESVRCASHKVVEKK
jgi:phage-related minor tail protein